MESELPKSTTSISEAPSHILDIIYKMSLANSKLYTILINNEISQYKSSIITLIHDTPSVLHTKFSADAYDYIIHNVFLNNGFFLITGTNRDIRTAIYYVGDACLYILPYCMQGYVIRITPEANELLFKYLRDNAKCLICDELIDVALGKDQIVISEDSQEYKSGVCGCNNSNHYLACCNKLDMNGYVHKNAYVHKNCYNTYVQECSVCHKLLFGKESPTHIYCSVCKINMCKRCGSPCEKTCSDCGKKYCARNKDGTVPPNMSSFITYHCSDCDAKRYRPCKICNTNTHINNLFECPKCDPNKNKKFCKNCTKIPFALGENGYYQLDYRVCANCINQESITVPILKIKN